jgi:iron complex transport system substrate-binding protein
MSESATREHEISPRGGKRRRGPYLFLALIVIAITGAVFGIELVRRLNVAPAPSQIAQATSTGSNAPATYPRTLRDGSGELLTIGARPRRIVSQTLGSDEILFDVCERERIVAFSKIAFDPKYSPIASELREISAPTAQTAEEILQLRPDLIFVASYNRAETVEQLKAAGAPVFRFTNYDSLEDIEGNIRSVGQAVGEEARAEELVGRMGRELEAVRARIPPLAKRPRVMSYGQSGVTAGAGTSIDAIVRAAGAVNLPAEKGLSGFPKVSAEQVIEWQPDFIIIGAEEGKFEEAKRRLLSNPAVASTNAARTGRIIAVDNRHLLSVSHYIVRAIGALADALYATPTDKAR